MRLPSTIVLIPWVLSLALEFWLVTILWRNKLYRQIPVFSAMVIIYGLLDAVALGGAITRFYAFPLFTLREISSVVLRTWLLIDLCRSLLMGRPWTRLLLVLVLVGSATFLIGVGFPVFLSQHTEGHATTYLHLGVWFRTAYFAQVGVIAILFLMNFSSMLSDFTREIGLAIGLATTSAAELVSMTLRVLPGGNADTAMVSLNYVGMVTACAIWIMFLLPGSKNDIESGERREVIEAGYPVTTAE